MVIFCVNVSDEKEVDGYYKYYGWASHCPICQGHLNGFGWRQRIVIQTDGSKKVLLIHRLQCAQCEKIHHLLPDILIPYKRHCAETVLNIIDGNLKDVICDDSTIHRIRAWWNALSVYFMGIIGSLKAKFGLVFSKPPHPKEIVRAVANAHLWVSTRSVLGSG